MSTNPVLEAVAGTLILEWAKLANYTGNKKYLDLAEKSMRRIGTNVSIVIMFDVFRSC